MTLQRDRTHLIEDLKLAGETYGVFYHPKGTSVFSATRAFRFIATFDSLPSESLENVFSWGNMTLYGDIPEKSNIKIYIKSSSTIEKLSKALWEGPFLNGIYGEDISSISGKFISVRLLLESYSDDLTLSENIEIDKLAITALTYGTEEKFFTKTFELGFIPKHIVLTYNGEESEKDLVQFSLTGKDSVLNSDYQMIPANQIIKLDKIQELTNKVKLMIRAVGSNEHPVSIDCFALTIGGEGKSQMNQ